MGFDTEEIPTTSPDHLAQATEALGEPEALFQVNLARQRTKLITGAGLIIFGVVANYLWWVHNPRAIGFEIKLLILPVVFGIGLIVHMLRNRGLSVLIYPTGILRLRRGEVESFPWEEIETVRLKGDSTGDMRVKYIDDNVSLCWLEMAAPTFQVWNTWISIKTHDGSEVKFTPALADYAELNERVQKGTFEILWPRAWKEIQAGGEVLFGDLTANLGGLRQGKQFLAWTDIEKFSFNQKHVVIRRKGKWLPWFTKDLSSLANLHILYALYDTLSDLGASPSPSSEDADDDVESEDRGE